MSNVPEMIGEQLGKAAGFGTSVYRTGIAISMALIIWLVNQVWSEALEVKKALQHDVQSHSIMLTDHATRIGRAEQDIHDEISQISIIDRRVSIIEGKEHGR